MPQEGRAAHPGADCWVEPDAPDRPPSRLLLLVQDRTGYLNLCELSRAWLLNVLRNQACLKLGGWPS